MENSAAISLLPASLGRRAQGYVLALVLVATALAITIGLQQVFVLRPPLFAFFAAIALAAWLEGLGPGLFAVTLSVPLGLHFYLAARPDHDLHSRDILLFVFFAACAFAGGALYARRRRAEEALQTKAAELQQLNHALTAEMKARQQTEAAMETLRDRLEQASRLTAMAETAAAIAHEINQPLAAVATNVDACVRWLDAADTGEARQAAQRAARDVTRAGDVVLRIRGTVKHALAAPEAIAFRAVIAEVLALLRGSIERQDVRVTVDVAPALPVFTGDRVQLQQVFLNLIGNALESLSRVTGRARQLWIGIAQDDGGAVRIVVRDNGAGFGDGDIARLFDPFVTTKPGGMGMGLAICRSIVEAHGGTLTAGPASPCGAEFTLTLPVAGGENA